MRFLVPFAVLSLAACGLPGTGPAQWTELTPVKQAELEAVAGTRPPPPEAPRITAPAAAPGPAVAAAETGAPARTAASQPAAPAEEEQAATAASPDVEALRDIALSSAQVLAVQVGLRDSLRDDDARVDRVVAGENSLGVVFVCGYAEFDAAAGRESRAFRGVLMGRDRSQPKFVPVGSSGSGAEEQAAARLCAAQGIPLSAATAVSVASTAADETAATGGDTASIVPDPADPAASPDAAPSAPMPKVVLTEPQVNIVQTGVKTSLSAGTAVFGRMLAVADTKGGIVVCGFVSPAEGASANTGIQPFTGVLIGEGDRRNFVPVGFGRDADEKRQTMQVCASQGIPL
jgi:hypothetical protein